MAETDNNQVVKGLTRKFWVESLAFTKTCPDSAIYKIIKSLNNLKVKVGTEFSNI